MGKKDKKGLENLPVVSEGTLYAHKGTNLTNKKSYAEFMKKLDEKLRTYNPAIWSIIHGAAKNSNDPIGIIRTGYTIYSLLESQIEANKLDLEFKE